MLGLRTQESEEFINFFKIVQDEAKKRNSVFFLDFGECQDIEFKNMVLEDLFGWLIPKEKVEFFEKIFLEDNIPEKWDEYCKWCIPKIKDNKLKIKFE